jgi:two-component system response regulator YesN
MVDDEPWGLIGLEGILDWNKLGFEIYGRCSSAFEALRAAEKCNPDLVITDIRMPQMNGADLISTLKQKKPDLECVIVSAYSDFEIARKAISYQAAGYILKPLEKAEVLDVIEKVKTRLDSKESKGLYIDMEDEEALSETIQYLERRFRGGNYCVILARKEIEDNGEYSETGIVEMKIRGFVGFGYFYSSGKKQLTAASGADSVRSIWHDRCSDLRSMFQEASVAFNGGFTYADHALIAAIQFFIGSHYDTYFTLDNLAEQFFISASYLCELFKKHTGNGVINFTKKVRLCNARYLLGTSDYSLKEIVQMVGFSDCTYFGRSFRQYFGISPGLYRRHFGISPPGE